MTTVAQALSEREDRQRQRAAQEAIELRVLRELPADIACPSVANEKDKGEVNAWVSFSRSYGETWTGADIFAALESAGFTALPATLAKYGDYRRSAHPGLQDQLPETSSRATLTDCEPIAPLWIVPQQHGESEAIAFYRSPSGLVLRVKVPAMPGVRISADRVNTRGDWYYRRGTARLHFPSGWHSVDDDTQQVVATVAKQSGAYVDTEKGVSGAIYFTPFLDHADFPLTPATLFRRLEAISQAK